ncbi:hypothetical protein ACX80N_12400 [Arthrobacter sp. MDT2-16]
MDGFDIVYSVQFFGGCALIITGALWSIRNPRARGEPLTGLRRRMMVLFLMGALLVINGFFGFARP